MGWGYMLLLLSTIFFIDAISLTAVNPSLLFYVRSVGGSKEQYGLIMSSFALFSIFGNLLYGVWVDKSGNKFRMPYITSTFMGIAGGLYYFHASTVYDYGGPRASSTAVALIFLGRIVGGFGAANGPLGYAYLAITVPPDEQTRANSLFSLSRIMGMTVGAVVNGFLAAVDTTISKFLGSEIHLTPLNSVGLCLAGLNVVILVALLPFLQEPPENKKPKVDNSKATISSASSSKRLLKSIFCIEIILPIFIHFTVNSSYQLNETALSPASYDALGWGTVEVSVVKSISGMLLTVVMFTIIVISKHVPDILLIITGVSLWLFGGLAFYFGWTRGAPDWHFIVPTLVGTVGFPFVLGANRASYSKGIASKPELESIQSTLQTIMSTAKNLAGVVTPTLVAAFVIRTPEDIEAAGDDRELTPWALVLPLFCTFSLIGLFFSLQKRIAREHQIIVINDKSEVTLAAKKEEKASLSAGV